MSVVRLRTILIICLFLNISYLILSYHVTKHHDITSCDYCYHQFSLATSLLLFNTFSPR